MRFFSRTAQFEVILEHFFPLSISFCFSFRFQRVIFWQFCHHRHLDFMLRRSWECDTDRHRELKVLAEGCVNSSPFQCDQILPPLKTQMFYKKARTDYFHKWVCFLG